MATCPVCEDYEGSPQQVQAHISANQDKPHKGKIGREFESEIQQSESGQQAGQKAKPSTNGGQAVPATKDRQSGQQSPQNGKEVPHRGGRSRGTTVDLPAIVCKKCGRKVKYPELMTYKASCQGCGRTIRKRTAFEQIEQQADEKGKNELAEAKEV